MARYLVLMLVGLAAASAAAAPDCSIGNTCDQLIREIQETTDAAVASHGRKLAAAALTLQQQVDANNKQIHADLAANITEVNANMAGLAAAIDFSCVWAPPLLCPAALRWRCATHPPSPRAPPVLLDTPWCVGAHLVGQCQCYARVGPPVTAYCMYPRLHPLTNTQVLPPLRLPRLPDAARLRDARGGLRLGEEHQ